jgi:hypothetical protein
VTHADEIKRRRDLFFEDVARAFDAGLEVAAREAERGKDPVEVARQALFTCLHNVFVTLDHGTQLADHFRVFLVDEDGNEVTPGALHEDFTDHLSDTGRLR